jgi:hypothetical protein
MMQTKAPGVRKLIMMLTEGSKWHMVDGDDDMIKNSGGPPLKGTVNLRLLELPILN